MTTLCEMGPTVGTIITYPIAGALIYYIEDNFIGGWKGCFYFFGFTGLIWCIFWFWLVTDSPETHPTISESERNYIIDTRK